VKLKTSEAFKKAKQEIYPLGNQVYICHALSVAAYGRFLSDWERIRKTRKSGYATAMRTIVERIGNEGTLNSWLSLRGVSFRKQTLSLMQSYRHAWLDQLIEEFEAKGD